MTKYGHWMLEMIQRWFRWLCIDAIRFHSAAFRRGFLAAEWGTTWEEVPVGFTNKASVFLVLPGSRSSFNKENYSFLSSEKRQLCAVTGLLYGNGLAQSRLPYKKVPLKWWIFMRIGQSDVTVKEDTQQMME